MFTSIEKVFEATFAYCNDDKLRESKFKLDLIDMIHTGTIHVNRHEYILYRQSLL